jgi:flagellar motility protein MotE (MotC chaperone)
MMDSQFNSPVKLAIIATMIVWLLIFMACFLLYQQLTTVTTQLISVQAELAKLSHSSQDAVNLSQSDIIAKIQQENQEIKKLLVDNLHARSATDLQLMQQIANTNKLVAQLVETMQGNVKSNERLLKQLDSTQQILGKVANSLSHTKN